MLRVVLKLHDVIQIVVAPVGTAHQVGLRSPSHFPDVFHCANDLRCRRHCDTHLRGPGIGLDLARLIVLTRHAKLTWNPLPIKIIRGWNLSRVQVQNFLKEISMCRAFRSATTRKPRRTPRTLTTNVRSGTSPLRRTSAKTFRPQDELPRDQTARYGT